MRRGSAAGGPGPRPGRTTAGTTTGEQADGRQPAARPPTGPGATTRRSPAAGGPGPRPESDDRPAEPRNPARPGTVDSAAHGQLAGSSAAEDATATPRRPALAPVGGRSRGAVAAPRCEHLAAAEPQGGALAPGTDSAPGQDRVEGLLLGLAAGDAAGWPAARHRAARMPEWTRRLTRELDTFAEQNATTTLPVPIALNQPPEPLRLGPSDDAEWAAFAAETVLTGFGELFAGLPADRRTRAAVDLAWNTLAGEIAAAADRAPEVESAVLPLRARISVRAGLGNLATGLRPPATGHDNPHYFDDAACVRAVVLAVVHPGRPHAAAELAEFDARYTQDGDGVHGARAMAAAVAAALGGADTGAAVEAALEQLPDSTEIGRNAAHAVKLARDFADEPAGAFALVPLLEHQIVDHVYSYGIAAAETVPVALALTVASGGSVSAAVPAAACLSRVADSAPALAGALTGALGGGAAVPAAWRDACRTLAGCALPRLAGTDLVELAGLLARTLAEADHNSR
ncbi:ADP-ribosylglycohydrolase family protein [Streptomyces niveus]|uniref:ADP-ribosylglycohydrolase family protein n=1 Tax=Streptomyces niveus TaxID=193462 RepID=UPI0036546C1B